jgi:hypothetical protein
VFHAVVLFYAHCAAPPPGCKPPRIGMDTIVEVHPSFKVRLRDAMTWANREAGKR